MSADHTSDTHGDDRPCDDLVTVGDDEDTSTSGIEMHGVSITDATVNVDGDSQDATGEVADVSDDNSGDVGVTPASPVPPKVQHLAAFGVGTISWVLGGAAIGAAMSAVGIPQGIITWLVLVAITFGAAGMVGSGVTVGAGGTWVPGWRSTVCSAGIAAGGIAASMTGDVTTGISMIAAVAAIVGVLVAASSAQRQQQRIIEHAQRGVLAPPEVVAGLIGAAVSTVVIGVGGWMWADAFNSPRIGGVSGTAALVGAVGVAGLAAWLGPVGVAAIAALSRRAGSHNAVDRSRTWTRSWWPLAAGGLAVGLTGAAIASYGDGRLTVAVVVAAIAFVVAVGVTGQYAGGAHEHRPGRRHGWLTSISLVVLVLSWAAIPVQVARPATNVSAGTDNSTSSDADVAAPPTTVRAVTTTTLPEGYVPQTPSPFGPSDPGPSDPVLSEPGSSVAVVASRFGPAFDGCVTATGYLGQRDCYIDYFDGILEETSSVDAMLDAVAEVHADPAGGLFKDHCHEVLHTLAEQAIEGSDDPLEILGSVRTYCTGGFAHGAMVTYMTEYGTDALIKERQTFCGSTMDELVERDISDEESTGWLRWNCDHMLGHALFLSQDAAGTVTEGAALCKVFPDDQASWKDCMAGYFMEYFVQLTRSETSPDRPTTGKDVFALCRAVDTAVAQGCYSESGALAVAFSRGAFDDAYELDEFVPDEHIDVFYESIGRMVTVYNSFDIEDMQTTCTSLPETEMADRCLMAIAGAMIMELQQPETATATCQMVSETNRAECESRTTSVAGQLESSGIIGFEA